MGNTSAKPFHWTMGENHGIKRRNWKILPYTGCSGHLKIPGNSQSWNMLVGFLWDAQLRAGWSEEAAKPWIPSWTWPGEGWRTFHVSLLGKAQTERALQGWAWTKNPTELKADAPSYGLFTQTLFCSAAPSLSVLTSNTLTIPTPPPKLLSLFKTQYFFPNSQKHRLAKKKIVLKSVPSPGLLQPGHLT